jgi:hypothetical protein
MENREFLVKKGDKTSVVSEKMARQFGRKVEVLGEVKRTIVTNGSEKLSPEEFSHKHITHQNGPDGKQGARVVDKGFKTIYDIDKKSRPGEARRPGTATSEHVILERGKEIPFHEWAKRHTMERGEGSSARGY